MSDWPHLRYLITVDNVFRLGAEYLSELLKNDEPTLILLSGGSAIKTYGPIADGIRGGKKNLIIGMVDERYSEIGHKDSNAQAIEEATGLWSVCQDNGVECRQILSGKSFEQTVKDYEIWVGNVLKRVQRTICILGIGADGHTAGILPMPRLEFDRNFHIDKLVVGYEAPGPYPQRITVTPALLKRISYAVLVGQGQDKIAAFHRALELKDEFSMHKIPATIIHQMPDVQVFINER